MSEVPSSPFTKVIKQSLGGFMSGIIGLIPILGMPFSVHAFFQWRRIDRSIWNPAARYSMAGAVLGIIGLLFSLLVMAAICVAIVNNAASHPYSNSFDFE